MFTSTTASGSSGVARACTGIECDDCGALFRTVLFEFFFVFLRVILRFRILGRGEPSAHESRSEGELERGMGEQAWAEGAVSVC
jgi:hypothetical protein